MIKKFLILMTNPTERAFAENIYNLHYEWSDLVGDYCSLSPLETSEILAHVNLAIHEKDFCRVFSGKVGWHFLKMINNHMYTVDIKKKYFEEHHYLPVLKILCGLLENLQKRDENI